MLRPFPRLSSNQELPDYRVLNRLFEIVERLDNLRTIAPMFLQDSPTGKGIGVALPPSPPVIERGAVYDTIPECTNSVIVQTTMAGGAVENITLDLRWPTAHPVANKNFSVGDQLAFIRYQPGGSTGLAVMPDIDGLLFLVDGDEQLARMNELNLANLHGKDWQGNNRDDFTITLNPTENCDNATQAGWEWNGIDVETYSNESMASTLVVPGVRRVEFENDTTTGIPNPLSVVFTVSQVDSGDNKYAARISAAATPPNCTPSSGETNTLPSGDVTACGIAGDTGWSTNGVTAMSLTQLVRIGICGTPPALKAWYRVFNYDACGKLTSLSAEFDNSPTGGTFAPPGGPSGTFTSADGHTITFSNGIITSEV